MSRFSSQSGLNSGIRPGFGLLVAAAAATVASMVPGAQPSDHGDFAFAAPAKPPRTVVDGVNRWEAVKEIAPNASVEVLVVDKPKAIDNKPKVFNDYTHDWYDGLANLSQANSLTPTADVSIEPIYSIAKQCPNQRNARKLLEIVDAHDEQTLKLLAVQLRMVLDKKFTGEFKKAFSHTLRGAQNMTDVSSCSSLFNSIQQAIENGRRDADRIASTPEYRAAHNLPPLTV